MKLIRHIQSSPEWLEWRKGGVTASDVSALFGSSPYKTKWKLWAEKTGIQIEDDLMANPYVRRGKNYEHLLREYVVETKNIGIYPACAEHDVHTSIRASLDGIDKYGRPWEFKIPSKANYELVRTQREKSEPANRYFYQVQHQLLVTGASEGFLVFGLLDEVNGVPSIVETQTLVISADLEVHNAIVLKTQEFMQSVCDGVEPAKDPERDLFAPTTYQDASCWTKTATDLLPLLDQRAQLKAQLEQVENDIKQVSEPLKPIMGINKYGAFAGLKVTRVDRKGSVDWQKLLADKNIDANDDNVVAGYRKPASSTYQYSQA